jgi:hypothetical protein
MAQLQLDALKVGDKDNTEGAEAVEVASENAAPKREFLN